MRKSPDIDLQCILFDHLTKPHKTKPHAAVVHLIPDGAAAGLTYVRVTSSDFNTWPLNICNAVFYQ